MKEYSIRQYEAGDYEAWNTFVSEAKNATFLFHRDFMGYHSDRFEDFSLMVFKKEKLVALLPANKVGNEIFSHQGITYGGLIYKQNFKLASVIKAFQLVLKFLSHYNFVKLQVKCIPSIYHQKPSDEMLYALFLSQAKLIRRDSLAVIDLRNELSISKGRLEGVTKGIKNNLRIVEDDSFDLFWTDIMLPLLERKYQVKPIHTLDEIKYLHSKFPNNIRQFNVYNGAEIVAGTTIFESGQVAHAQYISANESKNELGSLDFLYHHLATHVFATKKYLDFGISNEYHGKKLNFGLSFWKESFGASAIVHDFYEVETSNFTLLEDILL